MSKPIKTLQVRLYHSDARALLAAEEELPTTLTIARIDPDVFHGSFTLEHHIDANDTGLQITLCDDGTWFATKHVEV